MRAEPGQLRHSLLNLLLDNMNAPHREIDFAQALSMNPADLEVALRRRVVMINAQIDEPKNHVKLKYLKNLHDLTTESTSTEPWGT